MEPELPPLVVPQWCLFVFRVLKAALDDGVVYEETRLKATDERAYLIPRTTGTPPVGAAVWDRYINTLLMLKIARQLALPRDARNALQSATMRAFTASEYEFAALLAALHFFDAARWPPLEREFSVRLWSFQPPSPQHPMPHTTLGAQLVPRESARRYAVGLWLQQESLKMAPQLVAQLAGPRAWPRIVPLAAGATQSAALALVPGGGDEGQLRLWGEVTRSVARSDVVALSCQGDAVQQPAVVYTLLSNGELRASTAAFDTPLLQRVLHVSSGASHTCALDADGAVWVRGEHAERALGLGADVSTTGGQFLQMPFAPRARDVSCSATHTLLLDDAERALWGCGSNRDGQLGAAGLSAGRMQRLREHVALAVAGDGFSFCVDADGTLVASGRNADGQLGLGDRADRAGFEPVPLHGYEGAGAVLQVGCGARHTLLLTRDSALWGCGDNSAGQLGDGIGNYSRRAVGFTLVISVPVLSFACGAQHSLILTRGGLLSCGANSAGQLGRVSIDVLNAALMPVEQLRMGSDTDYASQTAQNKKRRLGAESVK